MKKLTFTLLLAVMAIVSAQAAKVYLKIGEGQVTAESNLGVWVWNKDEGTLCANKEWPGDKLTEKETIGTADYFVYTVNTEGSYNLIFNNNDKSNNKETDPIRDLTGDYTFVLNNDNGKWRCDKTEGAPSAETPVETYTVKLGGNAYGAWSTQVTFTYNAETKEYVYEETEPAKLADYFKIDIPETNKWFKRDDLVNKNLSEASSDFVAMNDNSGDMKITDAADYSRITLTVKNDNGTWKLKVVGVKTDKVQITGKFNSWKVVDMVSNPNGTYTYEVEENMAELSNGFGFKINGAYYAGDIVLDLDGDAVTMVEDPGTGKNLTLIAEGDVASVILTVAKDGDNWTVKAATGKTSSVAGVDAAGVAIVAANGEIVVDGAQSVAVYTTAGALVSTDARTRVAAGLYIVRADNVVKKVIVK